MQSHCGFAQYTEGDEVLFSNGAKFANSRRTLFPLLSELEEWIKETSQNTSRRGREHETHMDQGVTEATTGRQPTSMQRPTENSLQKAHGDLSNAKIEWQDAAIVDGAGQARVRRHPTRRYRARPTYIIPVRMTRGVKTVARAFPDSFKAPKTQRPQPPQAPSSELQDAVKRDLKTWKDCLKPEAWVNLSKATSLADINERVIKSGTPLRTHRQRAKCGTASAEVRIGPEEYHPTVIKVLQQGFTIDLTDGGKPQIRQLRGKRPGDWGVNARMLLEEARKMAWPDEELLFFLEFGFMDYSGNAPPVCSFSPHQNKAIANLMAFKDAVDSEIQQGWMGPPLPYPPSIPFQVKPGSVEPKKQGNFRLVWNASWPAPGSHRSAVKLGEEWLPIAPNSCTVLPSALEFEWRAIETNNEAIAVMAEGAKASGAPVLGRTFDFSKWFRQLSVASLDLWKCVTYTSGAFREDLRMQMGRRSSAHSAQRATFLITAILQRAA